MQEAVAGAKTAQGEAAIDETNTLVTASEQAFEPHSANVVAQVKEWEVVPEPVDGGDFTNKMRVLQACRAQLIMQNAFCIEACRSKLIES